MGVLSGIKVLDFSALLPGPFATLALADMGAEVLRVSSKGRLDITQLIPPVIPGSNLCAPAANLGRNKKSISLNLKTQQAKEIVYRLVKEYDVVIEQFRPGVMEKLGLGFERLREINPKLIYCSLTGYGQYGAKCNAAGHDLNYLARSGILSYAGRKDEVPSLYGIQIADLAAGSLNAVIGILGAIIYRSNTGKGQHVDVAMLDGCISLETLKASAFLVSGVVPKPEEERTNGAGLYDVYMTKDQKLLTFGGLEQKFFETFCDAVGLPELKLGGCTPKELGDTKEKLKRVLKTKTRDEWVAVFSGLDVCVEPVLTLQEALVEDEHVRQRGMVVEVPLPADPGVRVKQIANPIQYSEAPNEYRHAAFPVGYHTDSILQEIGYSETEIAQLAAEGTFD